MNTPTTVDVVAERAWDNVGLAIVYMIATALEDHAAELGIGVKCETLFHSVRMWDSDRTV